MTIDSSSIISNKTKIHPSVNIGPFCIIGDDVEIEEGTSVLSHAIIKGPTKIGKNNTIYQFSSIGEDTPDKKFKGEDTKLIIGDDNVFREGVTVHRGTIQDKGVTKIGNGNLFMAYTHIAHDCLVGNNVILANNVPLGGHAHVDDYAIVGGNSAVQQFTRVGRGAMIGGMCGVVRDVIPYGIAHGNRSILQGLNLIGLRRKNIPNKEIMILSDAYKEIFKSENLTENLSNLSNEFKDNGLVSEVVGFIEKDKKRPICTPFSK